MGQLVPRLGERELKLLGVLLEALRDLPVARVELERKIGGEHDRGMPPRGIVRVWHKLGRLLVRRDPLRCAAGAFALDPVVGE